MPTSVYTPAYRRLCRLLVQARKAASLTQEELAQRLDRPQSFVSKVENGERRLDVVEFVEVAEALNVDALSLVREVRGVVRRGDSNQ